MTLQELRFRCAGDADVLVSISNLDSILDVKGKYITKSGKSAKATQVRLFCMGKELTNENFLYSYDIDAEKVITILIR